MNSSKDSFVNFRDVAYVEKLSGDFSIEIFRPLSSLGTNVSLVSGIFLTFIDDSSQELKAITALTRRYEKYSGSLNCEKDDLYFMNLDDKDIKESDFKHFISSTNGVKVKIEKDGSLYKFYAKKSPTSDYKLLEQIEYKNSNEFVALSVINQDF